VENEKCEHRKDGYAVWIENEAGRAPVVFVYSSGPVVLTLSKKTILMQCPTCEQLTRPKPPEMSRGCFPC